MFSPLAGYKTYIIGALTILGAVGSCLVGDITVLEAVQLIVPAVLGMTVRHGVSTGA